MPLVLRFVRAFGALAFLCVLVIGAAPILPPPVLLVYSFTVNGDAQKESGARLAVLIGSQIAQLGGVTVKPGPPGTQRADFLTAARNANADYYLSGYVTPIGDEVSVVEQLVSAQTGIIAYSNTAQIKTYAEAAGQGDILRTALLRHQGRNIAAYEQFATPTPATPAPASTNDAGKANLGNLFKKKKAAPKPQAEPTKSPTPIVILSPEPVTTLVPLNTMAPKAVATAAPHAVAVTTAPPSPRTTPAPSPVAVALAAAADGNYLVLAFGGPADAERRDYATTQIAAELARRKLHGVPTSAGQVSLQLCETNGATRAIGGTLATKPGDPAFGKSTTAIMEFSVFDCTGKSLYKKSFDQDASGERDWQTAIDRVVGMATGAYLTPRKRR
jgi:hypothetical protein